MAERKLVFGSDFAKVDRRIAPEEYDEAPDSEEELARRSLEGETASADHGTVLPREAWALTWSKAEGFKLVMPDWPEEARVPADAQALAAAFLRLTVDAEFRAKLVAWVEGHQQ